MVGLVHLTYNESPLEIKVSDIVSVSNQQPSLTVLVAPANSSPNVPPTTTLNSLVQSVQSSLASLAASSPSSSSSSSSNSSIPSGLDSKVVYLVNQSDSIIYTLLSLLTKKDLINEHSSKYLIQYFQFFNYYISLGIQQVNKLLN